MSNPENPVGRAAVPAINPQPKTIFDGTKLPLVVERSPNHYGWYEMAVSAYAISTTELGFSARKNRNLNSA
jgi:hypothetical protein